MNELLLVHVAATLFMTGVIWFVQIVHYPLYANTRGLEFVEYERRHSVRVTRVVGPVMLVEAATALALLWVRPGAVSLAEVLVGAALLAVIWLSTAFIQVPCHEVLARGFDGDVHRRLVRTNWIRTVGWTLRALLVLFMTRPAG